MLPRLRNVIVAAGVAAVAIGAAYILLSHRHDNVNCIDSTQSVMPQVGFYGVMVELDRGRYSCDTVVMGTMHEGERVVRTIRFVNRTTEPLTLLDYRSSCGCTTLALPRQAIAPAAYADAECMFDSRGEYGQQLNVIEITTSDAAITAVLLVEADVE